MSSMLPSKMTMKFEKDRYVTELNAGMGMFRMRFIADNDNKVLEHTLKVLKEKTVVKMEEKEALKMIDRFPDLSIFPSLGRDTIAGLSCKRATGVFEAMEEPSMRIHYTDRIALKDPNWCNQFHELDGVLMGYEVKRFGKRMRLKAKKVESKEIPDRAFSTEDHKTISPEEMNEKMKKLMESFE